MQRRKSKYVYDTGLPFDKMVALNLDDIYDRVKKQKKGAIICVDGGVGEAKTTFSVHLIDYVNSKEGLPPCDLNPKTCQQLAMGGSDFVNKLKQCFENKLPIVVYDEAGDFNRRGALTNFNRMLNRVFDTFRTFQVIVVLVLPNFKVLDEDLFDKGLPRLLFHCHNKVQGKFGYFKAYDFSRMQWIKYYMSKNKVKQKAYHSVWFNFAGKFLDLTPERSQQLDFLSTKGKISELEKVQITMDGLLTYEALSLKLQKPIRWLRDVVKRLELVPAKRHGSKAYFSPEVVDAFVGYMDSLPKQKNSKLGEDEDE